MSGLFAQPTPKTRTILQAQRMSVLTDCSAAFQGPVKGPLWAEFGHTILAPNSEGITDQIASQANEIKIFRR